jgi:L-alanine-DL-glutamate epimerase-like enolase superfamily enzyme
LAAPVPIAHTHVHSLRLVAGENAGAEALVARVLLADGTAGFGFTPNDDAGVARDMAGWDALARSKGVPLHVLLGGTYRKSISVAKDELPALPPDWDSLRKDILGNKHDLLRIDPFAWGSLEQVVTIAASAAAFDLGVALLAPNAHPWEIRYCAALAATFRGDDTRIIVRSVPKQGTIPLGDQPGIGIDWSLEPAFARIQWQG